LSHVGGSHGTGIRDTGVVSHLAPVWFSVTDLDVVTGHGSWVTTTDGTEYLDFTCGIAVTSTGHCHPHVVAAIQRQAERFIHAQVNVYHHDLLEPLAARLAAITPPGIDTFFFSNSGAEATEASVKLAKQATKRPHVVVFSGSFHGRTHLTMAMTTSKTSYRAGHAPLPGGVFVAPFPDPLCRGADVDACIDGFRHLFVSQTAPDETAAVVIEPVLGEGGYIPAPGKLLDAIAEMCAQHGILFVADEVQTGFGRTGRMFAIEHTDIRPDILVMAKGIASGFPFSAIGASAELMARWPTGSHGGTYGGNPIGCAAALATLEVICEPGFLDAVVERGAQLMDGLRRLQDQHPCIADVRGLGLMVGSELDDPARAAAVMQHCVREGKLLLMNAGSAGTTVRWMPPLTVSADEVDLALGAFGRALDATA
jgi:4-aminobutyrate aminotransferase